MCDIFIATYLKEKKQMIIDINETSKIIDELFKGEIDLNYLPIDEKSIVNCLTQLNEAVKNANKISDLSNGYFLKIKKILDEAKKKGLLTEKKYNDCFTLLVDFKTDDGKLSEILFKFTTAFIKRIQIESEDLPKEQICVPFKMLANEITAINKVILSTITNFSNCYEKILAKLDGCIKTDDPSIAPKFLRVIKNFNTRLVVKMDETLYYKIITALLK